MCTPNKVLYESNNIIKKNYKHFDHKMNKKSAKEFINKVVFNKNRVSHYRFLPFITFNKEMAKYHRSKGKLRAHIRLKKRPLSLVAHHDAIIYKYYSLELSNYYESYVLKNKIQNIATAYRKKRHKSNIESAKEVFDFIANTNDCYIYKGDFKGFFDNIKHKILNQNLIRVLNSNKLKKDWKAVFKSITKYRYVNKDNIMNSLNKIHKRTSGDSYVQNRNEINKLINKGNLKIKGPNNIGIPQGTPLSAILANVYMIELDRIVNNIIQSNSGIYRRYSDDFIIIIPKTEEFNYCHFNKVIKKVNELSEKLVKLNIEKKKTKKLICYNNKIIGNKKNVWLDYLGFIFNGSIVKLRNKCVYKFHYKSKRSINRMVRIEKDRNNLIKKRFPPKYYPKSFVWDKKKQKFKTMNKKKKKDYEKRIYITQKKIKLNLTQKKITTRMYLTARRYGEKYSMVGYAKKAQRIMEKNGKYETKILSQIINQIKKNQKYLRKIKQTYKLH